MDVNRLFESFTNAAAKLEKRSAALDADQLYELQQQLGLVVGKAQKGIYDSLEKARRKS